MTEINSNIDPMVFENPVRPDPQKEKQGRQARLKRQATRAVILTESEVLKEFRTYLQAQYTTSVQALLSEEGLKTLQQEKIRANCFKTILIHFEKILQGGDKASAELRDK
jgi:hypothetical protein